MHAQRQHPIIFLFVIVTLILNALPIAAHAQTYPFMVYPDPNYGGSPCWSTQAERADIYIGCNDQISSVQLQPGWSVRVYKDLGATTGDSVCLNHSYPNLTGSTFDDGSPINDAISSFALLNSPWCDGTPIAVFPMEVYTDPNYGGDFCWSTGAETANIYVTCDNQISSVLLRSGWSVKVFSDPNQSGLYACLTGNTPDLTGALFNDGSPINDKISSFVLYSQPSCANTNQAPNAPQLTEPSNNAALTSRSLTLTWQDTGDPDNQPRLSRNFSGAIWKSDNSWQQTMAWQDALNWSITVPSDGTYLWHIQSGDGLVASAWSTTWTFNVNTGSSHTDTQFRAAIENGATTVFMRICGKGNIHRLSSELKGFGGTSQFLGDWERGSIDGCSAWYRPLIGAQPGAVARFYSTVSDAQQSSLVFIATARMHVCHVTAPGQISCTQGTNWPADPTPQPCTEIACLNLIFPLRTPLYITQGAHNWKDTGYSIDFGIAGDPLDTEPVVATHSGYLYQSVASGALCALVSTLPDNDPAGFISVYCHVTANSIPQDKLGTWVNQGDQIALMGSTGLYSTGPHVHYDMWHNGKKLDFVPICGLMALLPGEYTTCDRIPTQASTTISPQTGGSLNARLQPANAINAAVAATDPDVQVTFPGGITQTPLTADLLELFAPTYPLSQTGVSLRHFRLDTTLADGSNVPQFTKPYTLTVNYSDAELIGRRINEGSLALFFFDGSQWVRDMSCATCTLNTTTNQVTIAVTHLGEFALVGRFEYRVYLPTLQRP